MKKFNNLFSPLQLGTLELKNRLVMPAMHLGYCPNGEVTDQLIEFYRLRAKGGVGLVIVGGCGIDKVGNSPGMLQLDEDRFLPGLNALVDAVHTESTKIMAQLYHSGRYASSVFTGRQPVAPSPLPSKLSEEIPHELTLGEIKEMITAFAKATNRAKRAGFDGVEILMGTGYLISQFLSPVTNHRTDEYGGNLSNRMRFPLEIIEEIHKTVGADYPVFARIAGNDFVPDGHTHIEAQIFAKALESAGVSAINVTGGWHETVVPQITMNVPPGAYRYLARKIKEVVSVPVIASNRITTPELAEKVIASGDADLIGIARPLIADPFFPLKAYTQEQAIRPCIGCNQGCLDRIVRGKPVACLVNPEVGQETELIKRSKAHLNAPASKPKRFLIIGAGAAGLEFARVASLQGHYVSVWEKTKKAGGQLNLAEAPPGRQDFNRLTFYLQKVCEDQGVQFSYEQTATSEKILESIRIQEFTDLVLATGARPVPPSFPHEAKASITQAWDVLSGKTLTLNNVVIVGGGAVGIETALYLAEQGTLDSETLRFLFGNHAETPETLQRLLTQGTKNITLIEMSNRIGQDIGPSTRWLTLAELKRRNVKVYTQTKVVQICQDGVWVTSNHGDTLIPCDTTVLALGSSSNQELFTELQSKLPPKTMLHLIGDAFKPSNLFDALHKAYMEATSSIRTC